MQFANYTIEHTLQPLIIKAFSIASALYIFAAIYGSYFFQVKHFTKRQIKISRYTLSSIVSNIYSIYWLKSHYVGDLKIVFDAVHSNYNEYVILSCHACTVRIVALSLLEYGNSPKVVTSYWRLKI